jgi:hypothetical protein
MENNHLSEFASKVLERNRISFGDVQRLKRDIFPDGIGFRREAEALVALDREIARADAAWARWLVTTIVEFVVWAERPTGIVDERTALWLADALSRDGKTRLGKSARLIARGIAEEAHAFENDAFAALVGIAASGSRRSPARRLENRSLAAAQL